MRSSVFTRLLAFVVFPCVLSCGARSQMFNMWVDPDYPPGPMTKLLVLALWEDGAAREAWESAFTKALERNDVVAVPGHRVFPSTVPDSASVFDAARAAGCDGVVAIYETYENSKTIYVPGYLERSVEVIDGYLPAFPLGSERVTVIETYHPPYDMIETAVRCDVEVWTAPDDVRRVWSGTTEVIEDDPDLSTCAIVAGWVEYQLVFCGLVPSEF